MTLLEPLATPSDLAARAITVPAGTDPAALLAAASDAVRDAAGCSISFGASIIVLVAQDPGELDLPAGPVAAVTDVIVGGVPIVGWRKVGDVLLMPCGWAQALPVEVQVTYTHGYPIIPADIVDLVCGIVSIAAAQSDDGYGSGGRLASVRLGTYAETYAQPAGSESPSPVAIPDRVRDRLRERFGCSVAVVGMRTTPATLTSSTPPAPAAGGGSTTLDSIGAQLTTVQEDLMALINTSADVTSIKGAEIELTTATPALTFGREHVVKGSAACAPTVATPTVDGTEVRVKIDPAYTGAYTNPTALVFPAGVTSMNPGDELRWKWRASTSVWDVS